MRHLFLCLIFLISFCEIYAVPANPKPQQITQPDGSIVTLSLKGDEFTHITTTIDGYTVVKNSDGFYYYAVLSNGSLEPSSFTAHNADARSSLETNFLENIPQNLNAADEMAKANVLRRSMQKSFVANRKLVKPKKYDTSHFKGLVILVEFNDKSFSRSDIKDVFNNMLNQHNYTGFSSVDGTQNYEYTGSVRDYFFDNSMGNFDPHFDVAGPYKIPYSQTYPAGASNNNILQTIAKAACTAADNDVDFSKYDTNNDGKVDMIYFIYAGHGSNVTGNNSNYIWPHASNINNLTLDNVKLGEYACSTEFGGSESTFNIDGIGTICHEFSHVLGLWDEYDTDYAGSNGSSAHPGEWSLMASGGYLNNSRTPCSYSLFQRYTLGWANPVLITSPGKYSLEDVTSSNTGFRINTPVNKEFFLIENHQNGKWDKYLPGKGMLVFRVDSTSTTPWNYNTVNADPRHNYYELIRSKYVPNRKNASATINDPFPGLSKITSITNYTYPALKSWSGADNELVIHDIESNNGVITFSTTKDESHSLIEDYEAMELSPTNETPSIEGVFSGWKLSLAKIISSSTSAGTGTKALGLIYPGSASTLTPITQKVDLVKFDIWNPTTTAASVRLYYSTDNGTNWRNLIEISSSLPISIDPQSHMTFTYPINNSDPVLFKISQTKGDTSKMIYIDNFTVMYSEIVSSGIESVNFDRQEVGKFRIYGKDVICPQDILPVSVYNIEGRLILQLRPTESHISLNELPKGIYILRQGSSAQKVIL